LNQKDVNMKKLLLTAAAILATLNMYGQGTGTGVVNFNNIGASNPNKIWVNTTGVVGDGQLAAGTSYRIALYWGPLGAPEVGLVQIGASAGFLTGTAVGIFSGGSRTVTGLANNGDMVTIQARAWQSVPGADTWELQSVNPNGWVGMGPVFDHDSSRAGDPTDPAIPIGQNPAWRGFSISPVPEPSVIGLGLLGAGALLMLRRRK
jgi:hypothetical protein